MLLIRYQYPCQNLFLELNSLFGIGTRYLCRDKGSMGKNPSEFLNELPGVFKEPITSAADSYHVDTYPDSDFLLYSYPDPIKIS